jgi:arginine:agmatine antiporter
MNLRTGPAPPRERSLGLAMCTALVIGNMVGSGFYLAPSALAPFGGVAILGWIVTAAGSLCLALVFARLGRRIPQAGGPYAYTRAGFGDFAGFLIAWGYWISIWTSLPSIALAFGGYLVELFPGSIQGRVMAGVVLVGLLWLMAGINLLGVKEAGRFQVVVTSAKMIPILAIATIGLGWVRLENVGQLNPAGRASSALSPPRPRSRCSPSSVSSRRACLPETSRSRRRRSRAPRCSGRPWRPRSTSSARSRSWV